MKQGLDHWTTGPLIPLTECVLTLWIESCQKATFEYMKQGLDHWTTGPLVPLTDFVLTTCIHTQYQVCMHSSAKCSVRFSMSLTSTQLVRGGFSFSHDEWHDVGAFRHIITLLCTCASWRMCSVFS
jgi:hypothetical protein